jgi:hypothetical protein
VLLDENPLENIHNTTKISPVVLSGRLLARTELDGLLAQAERGAKSLQSVFSLVIRSNDSSSAFIGSWDADFAVEQAINLDLDIKGTDLTGIVQYSGQMLPVSGCADEKTISLRFILPDNGRTIVLIGNVAVMRLHSCAAWRGNREELPAARDSSGLVAPPPSRPNADINSVRRTDFNACGNRCPKLTPFADEPLNFTATEPQAVFGKRSRSVVASIATV